MGKRLTSAFALVIAAASTSHSHGYVPFQAFEISYLNLKWFLYAALIVTFLAFFRSMAQAKVPTKTAKRKEKVQLEEFCTRAPAHRIQAGRDESPLTHTCQGPPKSSHNLLVSASGREYLMVDLGKRLARRVLEIRLLQRIVEKLRRMCEAEVHEREHVRIEAYLPISVMAPKREDVDDMVAVADDKEKEDDVFQNLESVKGPFIDISEGAPPSKSKK